MFKKYMLSDFVTPAWSKNKFRSTAFISAGLLFGIGALGLNQAVAETAAISAGVCDVVATSSVKIEGIKTTLNSAQLLWKESHTNGHRFFCYGLTPQVTCPTLIGSRSQPKVEAIYDLKPQTKYYFKYHANWGTGTMKSPATGSFTTDTSSCGIAFTPVMAVRGLVTTAGGDPLEGVRVVISKTKGGASVDNNNTLQSGLYSLKVTLPGKYYLSYTYSPYAAPAVESVTVVTGAPVQMATVKMTGAFQVGGFVFGKPVGQTLGSVIEANVKIFPSTDSSKATTRKVNAYGHFNFALVAGTYTMHANFNNKNFSPRRTVVVDKDWQNVDLTLTGEIQNLVVGIQEDKVKSAGSASALDGAPFDAKAGAVRYQVNGAQLGQEAKTPSPYKVRKGPVNQTGN